MNSSVLRENYQESSSNSKQRAGLLDPQLAKTISSAADEVITGKLDDHFPTGGLADRIWNTD
ncbi:MAG: hypothetical protein CM1200mP10_26560 [Candidatus Neomarinimicrobiota bacterium]|nr:MAG: hypothetical protein CM1200mP10_26560 [Candidatus Neomarinimicrobiota bacterium]